MCNTLLNCSNIVNITIGICAQFKYQIFKRQIQLCYLIQATKVELSFSYNNESILLPFKPNQQL